MCVCASLSVKDFELLKRVGQGRLQRKVARNDLRWPSPSGTAESDEAQEDEEDEERVVNYYLARRSRPWAASDEDLNQQILLLREYPGELATLAETELAAYTRLLAGTGAFEEEPSPSSSASPSGRRTENDTRGSSSTRGRSVPHMGSTSFASFTTSSPSSSASSMAMSLASREPPLAPVLGSFRALCVIDDDGRGDVLGRNEDCIEATWLVSRWDGGLTTVSTYPTLEQESLPGDGMRIWRKKEDIARERRFLFLRRAASEILQAVHFCHAAGVVHRSISGASVLMSTYRDSEHDALRVRLTDFGLARDLSSFEEATSTGHVDGEFSNIALRIEAEAEGVAWPSGVMKWAKGTDSYALGLTLAELFFSALSRSGPNERTSRSGLQRLLLDVFQRDMEATRDFCAADDDWKDVVAFLDLEDGQGWALLGDLLLNHDNLHALSRRYRAFFMSQPTTTTENDDANDNDRDHQSQ